MTGNNPVFQADSGLELDTGLLIHPRPPPFTDVTWIVFAQLAGGGGRW